MLGPVKVRKEGSVIVKKGKITNLLRNIYLSVGENKVLK